MKIKNDKLHDALQAVTKLALRMLTHAIENEAFVVSSYDWHFVDCESCARQYDNKILWSAHISRIGAELTETKEYRNLCAIFEADENFNKHKDVLVGTKYSARRIEIPDYVNWCLRPFLITDSIIVFDEELFLKAYLDLERVIHSSTVPYQWLLPIAGLKLPVASLKLTEQTELCRLEDSEVENLMNKGVNLGDSLGPADFCVRIHRYAIRVIDPQKKRIGEDIPDGEVFNPNDDIETILQTINLFKSGGGFAIATIRGTTGFLGGAYSLSASRTIPSFHHNRIEIEEDELENFKACFELVKEANRNSEKKFLVRALHRFYLACTKEISEDVLIDLMICGESLFLSRENRQGIGYLISQRAALLLGTDKVHRYEIYQTIKSAYDLRSSLVHGSAYKVPKKRDGTPYDNLTPFTDEVEKLMREAIMRMLEEPYINWTDKVFSMSGSAEYNSD